MVPTEKIFGRSGIQNLHRSGTFEGLYHGEKLRTELPSWLLAILFWWPPFRKRMLRVRECYDGGQSETSLLDNLCKVDLLVQDEVSIQRGSSGEKVILNQVVERLLPSMRLAF